MRVLGIDPGVAIVGYGVVEQKGNKLTPIQYGSVQTKAGLPQARRLKLIYDGITEIIKQYRPDVVSIEKLFFSRNVTTAFQVAEARGMVLLAAEEAQVQITEYTPLQVKMGVVGYGQAEKRQVQEMVRMILRLSEVPRPDDVADALAIAICELHTSTSIGLSKGRR